MTKKTVKKKTVKKLETSDSLNPVIGKMEQEVLKKKQKFKVEEKNVYERFKKLGLVEDLDIVNIAKLYKHSY